MKYPYVILGGTGHVGSALAEQLLKANKKVLVIGRNKEKEQIWTKKGASFETVDILDSKMLGRLFAQAERLFILNPPADPSGNAELQERQQIESIVKALEGLKPEKIVLASTYGARAGKGIFDLGTCYELEQKLQAQGSPLAIIRSAYYMSNFDMTVEMANKDGKLSTLFPADFKLPMVSPEDIGRFAAELMQNDRIGTFYIQARDEYSAEDAANILKDLLNKDIRPNVIPEKDWAVYMQNGGFSKESSESFVGMTKMTLSEKFEAPHPHFGDTTLSKYLEEIVRTFNG